MSPKKVAILHPVLKNVPNYESGDFGNVFERNLLTIKVLFMYVLYMYCLKDIDSSLSGNNIQVSIFVLNAQRKKSALCNTLT